jgi:hypothetical protein
MKSGHRTAIDRTVVERNVARRMVDHSCSARKLCARCAMMKVVQYRFKAFRLAFGRDPLPNEPLFFTENLCPPQIADSGQMIRQLAQAADAMKIPLPPLLRFLGLE